MKILVTGGTGVIGAGLIPELLQEGHTVRLLSRGARKDAREYADGVEPFSANVADSREVEPAAEGCDAVVHITGIVEEHPPEVTFQGINVEGTRNVVRSAESAGVRRFIFLSSLGADRGRSPYHQSKLQAEEIVRGFSREWVILRPGNVYGPGDDVISSLLKMVRSLPVVPVIDGGDQPFQPIWFADLGRAITQALSYPHVAGMTLELAGNEITSTSEVVNRLKALTGRDPVELSIGKAMAAATVAVAESAAGRKIAESAGLSLPLNSSKLQMLMEENVIKPPAKNALIEVFGIQPTPLERGLHILADELPELLPQDGVGAMERKRFWAILNTPRSPADVMNTFRERLLDVMPIEFAAEPDAETRVEEGATFTAAIPGRGNIQVRVEESTDTQVTLATIEGHPLAGIVRFRAEPAAHGVAFVVEIFARAANFFDWLAMRTVGRPMQNQNWIAVVEAMSQEVADASADVKRSKEVLDESEAAEVEKWIERMVQNRKRRENELAQRG